MAANVQELALVDCNNFYASCEKIFRPDLTHTPIIVLSNNVDADPILTTCAD
jgi:DNA polymerase V